MYDCLSDDDEEDEEMEPEPSVVKGCPLIQKIARDIRNEERQERNESRRNARVVRRSRRKKRKIIKEVADIIQETKETIQQTKAAAPRRSPRLNPIETATKVNNCMNLGANMHSARAARDLDQERTRQPYEPLPDMQLPRMFPPVALAAFNLQAMHLHEDMRYTPQPRGMGQETSLSTVIANIEEYCILVIHAGSLDI